MTFLNWFFPWSYLDTVNKIQLVIWLAQLVLAVGIWVWAVVLDKPFLVSRKDDNDQHSCGGQL